MKGQSIHRENVFLKLVSQNGPVSIICKSEVTQLCLTLCDPWIVARVLSCVQLFANPMDCSPPDSSVHGILQARILEWVAISFSRGSS